MNRRPSERELVDDPGTSASHANQTLAARTAHHQEIEATLHGLSDEQLTRWISDPALLERGHGALSLPQGDATVYVKLVPATALELQPLHRHSTRNLFQLPTYYQYRLGSLGLGVWREVDVHRTANQWVLSGNCPHFPLLHHWRVLPLVRHRQGDKTTPDPWGANAAIQRRVSETADATSSVALFLEHFPQTLGQWLADLATDDLDGLAAVWQIEAMLQDLLAFLGSRDLLHMDVHFENILTDGSQLFLSDFGLAISGTFRLDGEERAFFEGHRNFDLCTAITSHVQALVAHYDSRADWRQALRELNDGSHAMVEEVPLPVSSYLSRRGSLALAMGDFYRELTADLETDYPAEALQRLLTDS